MSTSSLHRRIGFRSFHPLLVAAAALPAIAIPLVILLAFALFRNLLPPAFSYVNGDDTYMGATLYNPIYPGAGVTLCPDRYGQEIRGQVTFEVSERTALDVYYAVRRPPDFPGDRGIAAIFGPLNPRLTGRPDSLTVPYAIPRTVGPLDFRIPLPPLAAGPWVLEVTARDGVRGANSFVIPFTTDQKGCVPDERVTAP